MSIQKRSILTGILYISLAIIGPIGFLLLPGQFNEASNLNAYASSHIATLWVWFLVEVLIIGVEIFLTVYLWKLLNEHNKTLSTVAFYFRMAMILVMIVNSIFLLAILFTGGSNADIFLPLHGQFVYIWQISFSFHVLLIGYIVVRYIMTLWRYLGVALILGAIGYLMDSVNHLIPLDVSMLTTLATVLLIFVMIGEIGMAIALILKKVVPVN